METSVNHKIYIKTIILLQDTKDITEIYEEGSFYYRKGLYYISYNEPKSHNLGNLKTTLIVEDSTSVVIKREGEYKHEIIVRQDEINNIKYETEHGEVILVVRHINIKNNLNSRGGKLYFKYCLESGGVVLSYNEVYIKIKKK